jgi:hypothetical protein
LRKPVLLNEEFKKRIAELVESLEEDASIEEDPDE